MRQIVILALIGALCYVGEVRSNELIREKRGWFPSLFGTKPQADLKLTTADITPVPVVSADLSHYPIWRVHKYDGVHLVPLSYVLPDDANTLQTNSEKTIPIVVADHRQPSGEIVPTSGPVVSSPQTIEQTETIPQITQPTNEAPEDAANLLQLASEFGITSVSQLPSFDEVASLLGTTTPEQTIEAIQDLASTADGRSLIRSYIEEQGRSKNYEGAASENVQTVVQPETQQNITDDLEVSESLLIKQYLNSFGGVANQDTIQMPIDQAQDPIVEPEIAAAPVEYDEVEADIPSSGPISRFFQWTRTLNPFGQRNRNATASTVAEPSQTNVVGATGETTSTNGEQSVNYYSVPIPALPEPAALPEIFGFQQTIPDLPAIHIPYHNIPAYAMRNVEQTNEPGHYVRVQLPVAGFDTHLPIDPAYLAQLKTIQLSPESQTYQLNYPEQVKSAAPSEATPSSTTPSEAQTPIQNTLSFNQSPIVVSDANAESDVQPTQTTANTENVQLDASVQPVAQLLLTTK